MRNGGSSEFEVGSSVQYAVILKTYTASKVSEGEVPLHDMVTWVEA